MVLEETVINYALENSFPIAVTIFLLWKDMSMTTKVTESLNEMAKTLAVISEQFKGK